MRAYAFVGFLLLGAAGHVFAPASLQAQFPFGDVRNRGGFFQPDEEDPEDGGGMMPQHDLAILFDHYAKGRPYILVSDTRTLDVLYYPLLQFAQQRGIRTGQISRRDFLEFGKLLPMLQGGIGADDDGRSGPIGASPFPQGAFPNTHAAMRPFHMQNENAPNLMQWADSDFRRRDVNGSGSLNLEEMPVFLRNNLAQWDTNQDGRIDASEYRAYFLARMQGSNQDGKHDVKPKPVTTITVEEEDWARKPTVFRAGKLPKEGIPSWFKTLDMDNDGQIALYEWRRAGKSLQEFQSWDFNEDGLITPEEAVKQQTYLVKNTVFEVGSGLEINGELGDKPFHIYNVKFARGKIYVIEMIREEQTGLDPFLRLLDSAGTQLAADDDSGGNLNARIVFAPKIDGTYQVIAGRMGNGHGPFTVKVRAAVVPNNGAGSRGNPGSSNRAGRFN